jgi:ribonuclease BN (tRNA processing enzyme)
VFVPGNRFTLYGPARSPSMLEGILEGQMNPHFSPLHTMKNLGATIDIVAVDGGGPAIADGTALLRCHENPHGATTALAWRVEADGTSVVWAPDAGYAAGAIPDRTIDFYRGADVLIHDATYSPEDWAERRDRGFSSIAVAADAAVRAGAAHLVLTHYDPDYGDDVLDALAQRTRRILDGSGGAGIALTAAREGLAIAI